MLDMCRYSAGVDKQDECEAAVWAIVRQALRKNGARRAESEMGWDDNEETNAGMFIISTKKTSMEKVTLTLFVFGF